jgi:hypothetical protein
MTDRDDERRPEEVPPPGAEPPPQSWERAARPDEDAPRPPDRAGSVGDLTPPKYDDGDSRVFYEGDG